MHRRFGLKPMLHALDEPTYAMAPRAAELYGISLDPLPELHGRRLEADETVEFGSLRLTVRFTPGHAPGHVVFVDNQADRVIGGDVLFQGSIGRTDLPGGDASALARSIEDVLYGLPDHFEVVPGHGPSTTIGAERTSNPYVNAEGTGMLQQG
jgi:glyoxylase-like metal-dependent hydrolase (beta-lactamase superfamily II)